MEDCLVHFPLFCTDHPIISEHLVMHHELYGQDCFNFRTICVVLAWDSRNCCSAEQDPTAQYIHKIVQSSSYSGTTNIMKFKIRYCHLMLNFPCHKVAHREFPLLLIPWSLLKQTFRERSWDVMPCSPGEYFQMSRTNTTHTIGELSTRHMCLSNTYNLPDQRWNCFNTYWYVLPIVTKKQKGHLRSIWFLPKRLSMPQICLQIEK